jgi:excinuclease ABC subunit A
VIKVADHIIDLGPEGGMNGGQIICEGPPEEIIHHPESLTALHLKPLLILH